MLLFQLYFEVFFSNEAFLKEKILPTGVNDLPARQKSKEIAHIKSQNFQSSSEPLKVSS